MRASDFVISRYKAAIEAGREYGLNPLFILTNAALEGGWGESTHAKNHNNDFGITAGQKTSKYWNGSKTAPNSLGLSFRIYKTREDGFKDYARLISEKYPDVYSKQIDIKSYATALSQSKYISEKNGDDRDGYRDSLLYIYNKIKEASENNGLINSLTNYKSRLKQNIIILLILALIGFITFKIIY